MLDAPLVESEVREAILSVKSGKSPDLDGFPAKYYKINIDIVAPRLTEVYKEVLAEGQGEQPPTFNDAVINVLMKKTRSPMSQVAFGQLGKHRLQNIDYILAIRLEKVVPQVKNDEQTGFIKGRSSADNLGRLCFILCGSIVKMFQSLLSLVMP